MPQWLCEFEVDRYAGQQCAWPIEAETEEQARGTAEALFRAHPDWSARYPIPPRCTCRFVAPPEHADSTGFK